MTEQTISDHLYTAGMPDPDLLIRTAGEMRVSNYLLWQISYAELVRQRRALAGLRRGRTCTPAIRSRRRAFAGRATAGSARWITPRKAARQALGRPDPVADAPALAYKPAQPRGTHHRWSARFATA
jgi:hypothetical protein